MKRHHSIPITECRTQPLKRHSDDVFIAFLLGVYPEYTTIERNPYNVGLSHNCNNVARV